MENTLSGAAGRMDATVFTDFLEPAPEPGSLDLAFSAWRSSGPNSWRAS